MRLGEAFEANLFAVLYPIERPVNAECHSVLKI